MVQTKVEIIERRLKLNWTKCIQRTPMNPILGMRSSSVNLSKQIVKKTPDKAFSEAEYLAVRRMLT